jgi:hypothetical protein
MKKTLALVGALLMLCGSGNQTQAAPAPHPQQPNYTEQGWHEPEPRLVKITNNYTAAAASIYLDTAAVFTLDSLERITGNP